MKKVISIVLSIAMVLSLAGVAFAANENTPLTLSADFELNGVNIVATEGPAITIAENANVTLTVVGDNYVKGATGFAGIYVPESATLTIVGDGTLTAVGGDAIEFKSDDYACYNLRYYYGAGAGIGGNGSFYMRDKHTDKYGKYFDRTHPNYYEEVYSNGMKGNEYVLLSFPNFGNVVIDMTGTINATGGNANGNQGSGAGIGSGGSDSVAHQIVTNGTVSEDYAPFKGNITITNGNIVAKGGSGDNIYSANSGAGIGTGCCSRAVADNNIDIVIAGGKIVATGANDAAAIGGGAHVQGGDITISGGDITAVSGKDSESGEGAGIGAGHMAYTGVIAIKGDAVVSATANGNAAGIGAGADSYYNNDDTNTDELHCENVIFSENAKVEFDGGKTTFFTVVGDNVSLKSDSAVCAIANDKGVTVGLASSFAEAVSVINEFKNVTTLKLIKDTTVDKTVVIEDDITIDGDGYTLSGASVAQVIKVTDEAVTPIKVDKATVTLKNITVAGGNTANNYEYQQLGSWGTAGDGIHAVNGAVVNIENATIKGGASDADYTRSAGSAIATKASTINVKDSVLANGRLNTPNVVSEAVIETDSDSVITISDSTLDSAKSSYAGAEIIEIYADTGDSDGQPAKDVTMYGLIYVKGSSLGDVNIVVPEGETLQFRGNVGADIISDVLTVKYVKLDTDASGTDTDETADLYDIIIEGNKQFINRLNSLDLTFKLDQLDEGKNIFEIIPSEKDIAINPVDNSTVRYEFHYDNKNDGVYDTATAITLGQVKVSGYGEYRFGIDASANETNVAHATKSADSIVDTFIPSGSTAAGEGELVISETASAAIIVPTRELKINITFPNAVKNNAAEYQAMKLTIVGGETKIEKNLGEAVDADAVYNLAYDLPYNTAYTVTVEGAGYRTARYTVTLNDNKTLNFWNNVMDEAKFVENGKESSKTTKNFLAGDIVKDNQINIYDLSAVVSYFASDATVENDYAKYDLNRDGVIDSKDVAYVLVSWGE